MGSNRRMQQCANSWATAVPNLRRAESLTKELKEHKLDCDGFRQRFARYIDGFKKEALAIAEDWLAREAHLLVIARRDFEAHADAAVARRARRRQPRAGALRCRARSQGTGRSRAGAHAGRLLGDGLLCRPIAGGRSEGRLGAGARAARSGENHGPRRLSGRPAAAVVGLRPRCPCRHRPGPGARLPEAVHRSAAGFDPSRDRGAAQRRRNRVPIRRSRGGDQAEPGHQAAHPLRPRGRHHAGDICANGATTNLLLTRGAAAAVVLIDGAALPALVATAGSAALGMHNFSTAVDRYLVDDHAHQVRMTSEDPSVAPVILSGAGALLDFGGVLAPLEALETARRARQGARQGPCRTLGRRHARPSPRSPRRAAAGAGSPLPGPGRAPCSEPYDAANPVHRQWLRGSRESLPEGLGGQPDQLLYGFMRGQLYAVRIGDRGVPGRRWMVGLYRNEADAVQAAWAWSQLGEAQIRENLALVYRWAKDPGSRVEALHLVRVSEGRAIVVGEVGPQIEHAVGATKKIAYYGGGLQIVLDRPPVTPVAELPIRASVRAPP